MFTHISKIAGAAVIALALVACGGGAGSTSLPGVAPSAGSTPTPHLTTQTAAKFTITIPVSSVSRSQSLSRKPQYISTSSQMFYIALKSVNGVAPSPAMTSQFTVNSTNCVSNGSGGQTCTFTFPNVPAANDVFGIAGGANAPGYAPPAFAATEFVETPAVAIAQGTTTAVSATAGGVISSQTSGGGIGGIALTPANSATNSGHYDIAFQAVDFFGNVITSPGLYANPVTVRDTDTSGQTGLSVNGLSEGTVATINSSSDTLVLTNTGAGNVNIQVSASASNFMLPSYFGITALYLGGSGTSNSATFSCTSTGCATMGSANFTIQ